MASPIRVPCRTRAPSMANEPPKRGATAAVNGRRMCQTTPTRWPQPNMHAPPAPTNHPEPTNIHTEGPELSRSPFPSRPTPGLVSILHSSAATRDEARMRTVPASSPPSPCRAAPRRLLGVAQPQTSAVALAVVPAAAAAGKRKPGQGHQVRTAVSKVVAAPCRRRMRVIIGTPCKKCWYTMRRRLRC